LTILAIALMIAGVALSYQGGRSLQEPDRSWKAVGLLLAGVLALGYGFWIGHIYDKAVYFLDALRQGRP
jgi:hypothetical protein